MGVPQFFHWLTTHYQKHLLFDNYPHDDPPEYLYLDFNCGIHPAVKRPELVGKESFESFEEMYDAVCFYLDKILKAVKPSKMVYIAIDGVAPMAKIKQQRIRRFKAVQDRRELDRIDSKHKCYSPSQFDYNMISPGTEFMNGLAERLRNHIAKNVQTKYRSLQIILDDANNPGEGEHKICHHIRQNVKSDDSVVIYGLDSDLIFLSLVHYRPKFCLFREKIFFDGSGDKGDEYTYFDIGAFRKILLSIMNPGLSKEELDNWGVLDTEHRRALDNATMIDSDHFNKNSGDEYQEEKETEFQKNAKFDLEKYRTDLELPKEVEQRLILDYVSLCFILGNDFLPHLPSLMIKEGGLSRAMLCYKLVQADLPGEYLVTDDLMNYHSLFLLKFLQRLSEYEDVDLIKITEASEARRSKFRNGFKFKGLTAYERDKKIWEYVENKYIDVIKLGETGWKDRFYHYYIGKNYESIRNNMVTNYLDGMIWTLRYYQGNNGKNSIETCPDWNWKYDFRVGPAVSCVYEYLKENPNYEPKLLINQPVRPSEQLMLILPPQSSELVDPKLAKLMTSTDSPIITQYPTNFEIDMMGHRYRWECYPILPPINYKLTKEIVKLVEEVDNRERPNRKKKAKLNSLKLKFKKDDSETDDKKKLILSFKKKD